MADNKPVLFANATINTPVDRVRAWFLGLNKHPEHYRFKSHDGFTFTKGEFGTVGSEFYTIERFFGLNLKLRFIITHISNEEIGFDCLAPLTGGWCRFSLSKKTASSTHLQLCVGTNKLWHAKLLRWRIIRNAIQRQIDAEVLHIKASVERTMTQIREDTHETSKTAQ